MTHTFPDSLPDMLPPVLAYEPRGRGRPREPRHTPWAKAALYVAALTFVYTGACTIGLFQARGWDSLAWLVWGFIGNWVGGGVGVLFALVGCFQRTRRRALAVRALWVNLVVVAVPVILVLIPFWLN